MMVPPAMTRIALRSTSRIFLFKRSFSTINNNIIIPECFKPSIQDDLESERSSPIEPQEEISFHTLAACGYNGILAKSFEYAENPKKMAEIHSAMRQAGLPKNQTTFNYLIAAYMKMKQFQMAYKLIFEMETVGILPDLMTFEVLLTGLSYVRGMERTSDELFEMMQLKYSLKPTIATWTARITAWTHRRCQNNAIHLYESLLKEHQIASKSSALHSHLLKVAIRRRCWEMAKKISEGIRTKANPSGAVVSMADLKEAWQYPALLENPRSFGIVKFLFDELRTVTMEEASLSALLYYADKCGLIAADMAEYAMNGLLAKYRDPESKAKQSILPQHYIETYIHAMEPRTEEELSIQDQLITRAIRAKIDRFRTIIGLINQ